MCVLVNERIYKDVCGMKVLKLEFGSEILNMLYSSLPSEIPVMILDQQGNSTSRYRILVLTTIQFLKNIANIDLIFNYFFSVNLERFVGFLL